MKLALQSASFLIVRILAFVRIYFVSVYMDGFARERTSRRQSIIDNIISVEPRTVEPDEHDEIG